MSYRSRTRSGWHRAYQHVCAEGWSTLQAFTFKFAAVCGIVWKVTHEVIRSEPWNLLANSPVPQVQGICRRAGNHWGGSSQLLRRRGARARPLVDQVGVVAISPQLVMFRQCDPWILLKSLAVEFGGTVFSSKVWIFRVIALVKQGLWIWRGHY
jgi:hypothetical protein